MTQTPPELPRFVADFRREYRANEISPWYSGPFHLAFTFLSCLAIILMALAHLERVSLVEFGTVPLVFIYINLAEYLGHRGPMHHRVRVLSILFQRHTMQHHHFFTHEAMAFESARDFKMVLFPPSMIFFFGGGFALPMGLVLALVFSTNVGLLFVATIFGYFLNYEFLHFAYHCSESSWLGQRALIRRLRGLHTVHHNPKLMTRYNFNITYPIADRLFGTFRKN